MPKISSFYGISIYIYWQDHDPPHFHAIYGGQDAAFLIESASVMDGKLPKRAAKMVQEWANAHRNELLENWARAQQGEPLHPIEPLE